MTTDDDAEVTAESGDVGCNRSGGEMIKIAHHLTSVVTTKSGKVNSPQENEGQIAEAWIKCQESIHGFASRPFLSGACSFGPCQCVVEHFEPQSGMSGFPSFRSCAFCSPLPHFEVPSHPGRVATVRRGL